MRRVAAHVGIDVAEEAWPVLVEAARFDAMKSDGATLLGPMDRFAGGPDSFLYKGTNGRWRAALTPADLGLYDSVVSALDPDLRSWLEGGRSGQPGRVDHRTRVGQ